MCTKEFVMFLVDQNSAIIWDDYFDWQYSMGWFLLLQKEKISSMILSRVSLIFNRPYVQVLKGQYLSSCNLEFLLNPSNLAKFKIKIGDTQ